MAAVRWSSCLLIISWSWVDYRVLMHGFGDLHVLLKVLRISSGELWYVFVESWVRENSELVQNSKLDCKSVVGGWWSWLCAALLFCKLRNRITGSMQLSCFTCYITWECFGEQTAKMLWKKKTPNFGIQAKGSCQSVPLVSKGRVGCRTCKALMFRRTSWQSCQLLAATSILPCLSCSCDGNAPFVLAHINKYILGFVNYAVAQVK